ncbi:uracil-DNA glycosylase [Rhodoferax sp.]|uniref:uracil-DNA glycosylase n=1 Tax=Rhodoferax sp. TaxID=50421 RepID=UPI0019FB5446|nr:uracil-DNA glycosylase [Rhodoferax sp.]MBE0473750.1 uracil-DNA glycosylase [Rhodoferax sp.]
MSLALDARQRAMLLEMGVRVWQPSAPAEAATAPAAPVRLSGPGAMAPESLAPDTVSANPHSPKSEDAVPGSAPLARPVAKAPARPRPPAPTKVAELASGIASMDWPGLTETVLHCQACAMCLGRRTPVLAPPAQPIACDWLVLGDPPDESEERAQRPFVEAAGQLLDNMLRAAGVKRWDHATSASLSAPQRAYLTHVLKCRPALMRAPHATELSTCAHFLRREIALIQPKVILAMGRFAMQLLLSETPPEQARLPLGKLRGQVWRFADVPVVVTYPPAYLLRNGQDKARAWADLCLARAVASGASTIPSP